MKTSFTISGILGFFLWPAVMAAGVMLGDNPNTPRKTEILIQIAIYSALAAPIVWVVTLILAIMESKKENRRHVLRRYAAAPYAAAGAHLLLVIALIALAE